MVVEARRRPEVSIPEVAIAVIDKVQEVSSGNITVFQSDPNNLKALPYYYDTYDGALRIPYLYAGRPRVMVDMDNVGLAKEETLTGIKGVIDSNLDVALSTRASETTLADIREHVTGIKGVISSLQPRYVSTGTVDAYCYVWDRHGSYWRAPQLQDGWLLTATTGKVAITTGWVGAHLVGTDIMLPVDLQARYLAPVQVVNTLVNPGSIVTGSEHVSVANYRTKTVIGKCDFDGTLHIDCSPSGTNNYFTDVYTQSISSGSSFTASFTEAFDYVIVRIENTSSATGSAVVWVVRQA